MKRKRVVTKHGMTDFDEPQGAVAPLIDVLNCLAAMGVKTVGFVDP